MTTSEKKAALLELGKKRKGKAYDGFKNIGEYHNGAYESEWVSPYTKSAQNVDAEVFIMLQDWSSDDSLSKPVFQDVVEYGHSLNYATNVNLKNLLKKHLGLELSDCFATNLFPFIKKAGMSAVLPMNDVLLAAREFAVPQIKIVSPKLVIALGIPTFNALRKANGLQAVKNIEEGIASPFKIGNSKVVCQAHTGQLGKNNRNKGGVNRVDEDWGALNFQPLESSKSIKNENFINQSIEKMEIKKTALTEKGNPSKFEQAYEQFISELVKKKKIKLKDNGNNEHTIISENRKVKVFRDSGKHKPVSYNATRDLFIDGKHVGKTNLKEYSIHGNYSDDLRFCIAVAKHLLILQNQKN